MSKKVLSLENLHVQIGARMILQDISFDVHEGEVVGIIGPNGCGKTTLLNAISGFLPVDTGIISVNGKDIMDLPAHRRARMGIARGFQYSGVFRQMTVEENLMMAVERAQKYPFWWMLSADYRRKMSAIIGTALEEGTLLPHKK